jgi:hypothetical protein
MKTLAVLASAMGILIGALAVPSDADARVVRKSRVTVPTYNVLQRYYVPQRYYVRHRLPAHTARPPVYAAETLSPRRYDNPGIPDFQNGSRG